ncbi:hypothetical protein PFDG_00076 [Plasmodium falciparum Dd2]|uniref:Rifin n=1 Tax=Plasmodium falciparum (isolate Dd2) TaxID=57267 RepID=A0A0L7LVY4_PLAF4|nr:hypothetical protein PFDG_00076 [Plasmodium falciparum Dd2]
MKIHYINILLFELPLNILIYNQRNHKSTTHHTLKIPITRLLCECELYAPATYDDDPQMKEVMVKFSKQTQQRFEEYDERMKTTRQKCKDKCDKEIQKIILKDKMEKQMAQQLTTLETKIGTDDIPTCVCEKSMADKMEKGCLRCGYGLGTVAPTVGLIGSVAVHVWKPVALKEAINAALNAAASNISATAKAAGIEAGKKAVIAGLKLSHINILVPDIFEQISNARHYNEVLSFADTIIVKRQTMCGAVANTLDSATCRIININLHTIRPDGSNYLPDRQGIRVTLELILGKATTNAEAAEAAKNSTLTAEITTKQTTAINTIFMSKQTAILASVVAIVVIVLIMIIIYLILRYRRKKKMKKKLQYIKLLKE